MFRAADVQEHATCRNMRRADSERLLAARSDRDAVGIFHDAHAADVSLLLSFQTNYRRPAAFTPQYDELKTTPSFPAPF